MDCNKEDAIKAQQVAERKIVSEDYLGAKKFILKAQRLFPNLSGVPQMLAVVDVHSSACEASDDLSRQWHQILQVERNADEETIRKQYRRLLLLLHPDKNKYAGAASAFKLVKDAHEAFEIEKELAKVRDMSEQPVKAASSFWTLCPECKTPSEHGESLEHQYVQCLKCLRPFIAVRFPHHREPCQSKDEGESSDPLDKSTKQDLHRDDDDVQVKLKTRIFDESKEKGKASKSQDNDKATSSSSEDFGKKRKRKRKPKSPKMETPKQKRSPHAASTGGSSRQRRKKEPSVLETDSSETSLKYWHSEFVCSSVKESGYVHDVEVNTGDCSHHHMDDNAGEDMERSHDVKANIGDCSHHCKHDKAGDETHIGDCSHHPKNDNVGDDMEKSLDVKAQLFEKLKIAILNQFNGGEFQAVEVKQDEAHNSADGENDVNAGVDKVLQLKVSVSFMQAATNVNVHAAASENCMVGGSEIWEEGQDSVQCQVPDNDVYNFDKGRQEESFEVGQIWAVYDDDDGLPRFYAHIAEVISVHPFHVRMNWLYPAKTVSEDVHAWIQAGFAYTCGEFRLGKSLTRKSASIFSHIMAHETGKVPGIIRIYPQKDDVWALYKVWKPRKGTTRTCEPVEVISHFSEELGVQVVSLLKVPGYKSIYCRKEIKGVRYIPRLELTRFSHQIPAHYLVGDEVTGLPENCVDLDTAAINVR